MKPYEKCHTKEYVLLDLETSGLVICTVFENNEYFLQFFDDYYLLSNLYRSPINNLYKLMRDQKFYFLGEL